ncbi:hypothetical protein [Massilia sp. DWR3-1-1]|uniref:hypothetical protein n=1 Tax=Massilia sp. DWR3-1-1 TaxID=2804559 RepID=UPI003CE82BB2
MTSTIRLRAALLTAVFAAAASAPLAHADSVASSASSAGSASSGSVSDSLQGSSNSSTNNNNNRRADGTYQILEVTPTPGRANSARLAMQLGDDATRRIVLDLPQTIVERQALAGGALVHVQNRAYGLEFAQGEGARRQAFFLVLADEVYNELAARKVTL